MRTKVEEELREERDRYKKMLLEFSMAYHRWNEFGCGKELRILHDEVLEIVEHGNQNSKEVENG